MCCGDVEIGICKVCGEKKKLERTYFNYPVDCECHSPNHFETIRHCENCKPKEPEETLVLYNTAKPNKLVVMTSDELEHLLNCMCNQKYIHERSKEVQKDWQGIIDKSYHKARGLLSIRSKRGDEERHDS